MAWRFLAYDLTTDTFLAELNVSSWASTDELNGAGSFSATVNIDKPGGAWVTTGDALYDDDGNILTDDAGTPLYSREWQVQAGATTTTAVDATVPAKTLIVAERDGTPIYAGIPWRRKYDAASRTLDIAGAAMLSYFDHFTLGYDYSPSSVDQFTIFTALSTDTDDAIGIDSTIGTSGVTRDRTYLTLDGSMKGDLMRDLAAVVGGFDFDIRVEYSGDTPTRYMRAFYPRRGRGVPDSGVSFRVPGNADIVSVDEDAAPIAAQIQAVGAGNGDTILSTLVTSTDLADAGYPEYRSFHAAKDVTESATLIEHADAELVKRSITDTEVFDLDINPSAAGQPYGSWDLGDDCYIIIEDDPRYPAQADGSPGLATARRIVSHSWQVEGPIESLRVGLDLLSSRGAL